ncbi:MAG: ABC transporter permease [Acidobacteriaceae bacterium]
MHNVFLFARREFLERIRTKSFIITTILFPAMMLGFTILPSMMMNNSTGPKRIEVVAGSAGFADQIKSNLNGLSVRSKDATQYSITTSTDTSGANRNALLQRITDNKKTPEALDGVVWASDDAVAAGKPVLYGVTASDFKTQEEIDRSINRALQLRRLTEKGISASDAEALMKGVDLETHQVSGGRAKAAAGMEAFFTPFILMFMMYFSMLIYGMAVMRSVVEEKSSRIFEVLLSSATSKQLMAGKVLGVGAVGLAQIGIWATAALLFSGGALGAASSMLKFSPMQFFAFGVFFVLGYLIYSALFAAVGAMVNSEQEAQQLQTFVMLPLILCMVFITKVITDPNGSIAFWASMFPLTSPLLMYVRIIVQQPPMWQIALSIAIAVVSVYVLLALCSRIYRVGILMYGKRPTLPEIIKWIKYAS